MKNNFVVYTALFGDYDDLIDPKEKFEGCNFICFTDQKHLKSDIWEIRLIEDCDLPLNMMNRRYKLLPHLFLSEYEISLYIDANIIVKNNPSELIEMYLDNLNFALPKHFARDCIYEEAIECIISGKSDLKETKKQLTKYKNKQFPKHFGLGENNILLRKHNSLDIIKLMEGWWKELNIETNRDQLSLMYLIWIYNFPYVYMNESARNKNLFFTYLNHSHQKNKSILEKSYNRIVRFSRIIKNKIFL